MRIEASEARLCAEFRLPMAALPLLLIALAGGLRAASPVALAQDQPNVAVATAAAQTLLGDAELQSSAATVERGIADFSVDTQGGADVVLGRNADGNWQIWFVNAEPYQLTHLPGDMIVCADGDGLTLRSVPSGAGTALDVLADGTTVTAGQFVLTQAGSLSAPGYGWYEISAPESGWLYSQDLEDASLQDGCARRDQQVNG